MIKKTLLLRYCEIGLIANIKEFVDYLNKNIDDRNFPHEHFLRTITYDLDLLENVRNEMKNGEFGDD